MTNPHLEAAAKAVCKLTSAFESCKQKCECTGDHSNSMDRQIAEAAIQAHTESVLRGTEAGALAKQLHDDAADVASETGVPAEALLGTKAAALITAQALALAEARATIAACDDRLNEYEASMAEARGKVAELTGLAKEFERQMYIRAADALAAEERADKAEKLLADVRYFSRRWSGCKAVADYIDERGKEASNV